MNHDDIQRILSHMGDHVLLSVNRPESGLSGSVSVLKTDREDLILKVYSEDIAKWKPEKERAVFGTLAQLGIPVPEVLLIDCSRTLTPLAHSIARRLPGTTISAAWDGLSAAQQVAIYAELGDIQGRMHALTFEQCGDLCEIDGHIQVGPARELSDETGPFFGPFATWLEMHSAIVERHLRFLGRSMFADLVDPIRRWFRSHDSLIDYSVTPRLLHMDLHCGNVLVEDGRISGILDVEESLVGHNEYDLMRTELAHFGDGYEELREAFFQGYCRHVTLDTGYEDRKSFYELSRMLIGLRCIVTYGSNYGDGTEQEANEARQQVARIMGSR